MLQNKDYGAPNLIAGILLTRLHHCSHACPRVCARQVLKKNNEPVFTHNSEGVRPQTTIMPLPVLDTSRERGETAPLNHVLLIQVSATNSNLPFTYGISFILLFIMSFPLPSILSTIWYQMKRPDPHARQSSKQTNKTIQKHTNPNGKVIQTCPFKQTIQNRLTWTIFV